MADDVRPVVVAFDGSAAAREALTASAKLFQNRRLVVVSVWEPGLAMEMASLQSGLEWENTLPSGEEMVEVDRVQRDRAGRMAEVGVQLARECGATAEAAPVEDQSDIAETIATLAENYDACAVVVGSRGLGAVKSRLFGSTSRAVLRQSSRPVLVVTERE
jgi:nucleotide-binding universal stress UspA family protein